MRKENCLEAELRIARRRLEYKRKLLSCSIVLWTCVALGLVILEFFREIEAKSFLETALIAVAYMGVFSLYSKCDMRLFYEDAELYKKEQAIKEGK